MLAAGAFASHGTQGVNVDGIAQFGFRLEIKVLLPGDQVPARRVFSSRTLSQRSPVVKAGALLVPRPEDASDVKLSVLDREA